jgi:uncharacterized SAM-binding protein YcdF (DUF218 family)
VVLLFFVSRNSIRSVLTVHKPLETSGAIVLLAGDYEERAPLVAALYRAGRGERILLTDDGVRRGWSREHQRNLYTNERVVALLLKQGVPRTSIIMLPFWKSGTVYDAVAVRDYISRHATGSILLVTSDYHTRRSLWIFQRVLLRYPVTVGIEPSRSSLNRFPEIMVEYIKFTYYLIRFGWLEDIPGNTT